MKVIVCAGPPTSGKTTVLKQVSKILKEKGHRLAYLKIDVQFANEDTSSKRNSNIPTKKVYSGDLCPDHCNVVVLGDAIKWAAEEKADILLVETAGLCLRCSPYIERSLGIVVLEATSGMNLPRKIGPMLTLADVAVVTKIDLVSQAEREVFRANVNEAAKTRRCHRNRCPPRHQHRSPRPANRTHPRHLRAVPAPRQPARRHLHDLRREKRNRQRGTFRSPAYPGY